MMTAAECIDLSRSCAAAIYGRTAPSPRYAAAVASLLAGTAATESHLHYRRQGGFSWASNAGAWGLWQTEGAAVEDSLAYLQRRDDVHARAMEWLFQQPNVSARPLLELSTGGVLRLLSGWDRLACLMARLHYLRVPAAVPGEHAARAVYYKRYYNTAAGKATPEKYLEDYARLIGDAHG